MSYRAVLTIQQFRLSLRQSAKSSQLAAGIVLVIALAMIGYGFSSTGQLYIESLGANILSWTMILLAALGMLLGLQVLSREKTAKVVGVPARVLILAEVFPYIITLLTGSVFVLLPYYLSDQTTGSAPYMAALVIIFAAMGSICAGISLGLLIRRISKNVLVRVATLIAFGLLIVSFLQPSLPLVSTLHGALLRHNNTELWYAVFTTLGFAGVMLAIFEFLSLTQLFSTYQARNFLSVFLRSRILATSFNPVSSGIVSELFYVVRNTRILRRFLALLLVTMIIATLIRLVTSTANVYLLAVLCLAATIHSIIIGFSRSLDFIQTHTSSAYLPRYSQVALVSRFVAGVIVSLMATVVLTGATTPELYQATTLFPLLLTQIGVFAITYYFAIRLTNSDQTTSHRLVVSSMLLLLGTLPALLNSSQTATMISWLTTIWVIALFILIRTYRLERYHIG